MVQNLEVGGVLSNLVPTLYTFLIISEFSIDTWRSHIYLVFIL